MKAVIVCSLSLCAALPLFAAEPKAKAKAKEPPPAPGTPSLTRLEPRGLQRGGETMLTEMTDQQLLRFVSLDLRKAIKA